MYDIIVVGAGPTGSTAAKVLAEKGFRVLLVERCKLPRYKSCSGILIQKTIDLVRRYYGKDVPLRATCTPVERRWRIVKNLTLPSRESTPSEPGWIPGLRMWQRSRYAPPPTRPTGDISTTTSSRTSEIFLWRS